MLMCIVSPVLGTISASSRVLTQLISAKTTRRFRASSLAAAACLFAGIPLAAQTAHYTGSPQNFGSVNVGSASTTPLSFSFTFDTAGTLGSTAVLTQGAANLDFTDAGTGSCAANTAYNAGDTCTVTANFKPTHPGTRYGAAELLDSTGNLLATGYTQGTGVAPQVGFSIVTRDPLRFGPAATSSLSSGLRFPDGVAVDASGNVFLNGESFIGGSGVSQVNEILAGGTIKTLYTSVDYLVGLALDGSGNLFVGNNYEGTVKQIVAAGGYTTVKTLGSGFSGFEGLTVDGEGNIFVADTANNAVKEIAAAGGYSAVNTLGSGFNRPQGVAVDGSGNVFVADSGNRAVKEIPASCIAGANNSTCVLTLAHGFYGLSGVAVDSLGNVFASNNDGYCPRIGTCELEITAASGYTSVRSLSGIYYSFALAVDGSGNLYASEYTGQLNKLDFADPPTISFNPVVAGQTSSNSPRTVAVINNGNADLHLPVPDTRINPNISANFTRGDSCPLIDPGASSPGTMAAGATCQLTIGFTPSADISGKITGALKLTDDTLNAAAPGYATQVIPLSGTAYGPPIGEIGKVADSVTFSNTVGQADSVQIQGWVADPKFGAPLGNVTVYIDGTSVGAPTLGIGRPDIVAEYLNPTYANSGFNLLYPASSLSLGTHAVTVVAVDAAERSKTFGPVNFTVAASPAAAPPLGGLSQPVDSVTSSTTVGQANSVNIQGWVADHLDGAPLSNVRVYIDGGSAGAPTLGLARPDVVAVLQNAAYLNSGFQLLYPASALSVGTHVVTVTAVDSGGRLTTLGPMSFTVAATAGLGPPSGGLAPVVDSVTFSSTVGQSHSVQIQGWIADRQYSLSSVIVYIDGASVGAAKMVAPGFKLLYPASSLSIGAHVVKVIAVDSGGQSATFGPATFTVADTAGLGSPFGAIGKAVDSRTKSTTVEQSDSVDITGWVADPQDGSPLSNVTVYIDGNSEGKPTLGIIRWAVASAYNNNDNYLYSGYELLYPAASLSPGTHAVTVIAIDSGGRSTTFGPLNFTVQ